MRVDLLLGADVDAAHRVVHQHDPASRAERPGEQHLLLVAAGERQDVVVHVGRADVDALAPVSRRAPSSRPRIDEPAPREHRGSERDGDVLAGSTTAERCRRSGGRRRRSADPASLTPAPGAALRRRRARAACRSGRGRRGRRARRSRPDGRRSQAPPLPRAGARASTGVGAGHVARRPRRRRGSRATLPIAATRLSRVKSPAGAVGDDRAVRITTTRSAVARISPRRCEIRMTAPPARDEAADVGEQLAGERRRRARRSARRG